MSLNLLVISDIHGSMKSTNKIKAAYYKYEPDLSVICGDITHFGSEEEAVNILEKIPTDIIGVTGNCDPAGVEQAFGEVGGEYIELKTVERDSVSFIGLSGSDYSEEKVNVFKDRSKGADVYVLHQPPYGILDEASRGKHIGSRELQKVLEKNDPKLVLSGHVHEDRGTLEQEGTVYMNPGAAADDKLGFVTINGERVTAKLI